MLRWRWGVIGVTAGLVLAGCSVYDSAYVFGPGPVDVKSPVPGAADVEPARTLVTVVGVRREDSESDLPASVEVRLRVENTSPLTVSFSPASLVLFSAALEQFPDPIVVPTATFEVEPGESVIVDAWFPFPPGVKAADMDLSGLNVRWALAIDGRTVTSSASFTRQPNGYYDRYPNRVGVGFQAYHD
jgi:hypothetical protein